MKHDNVRLRKLSKVIMNVLSIFMFITLFYYYWTKKGDCDVIFLRRSCLRT